jgi:hypothetical protein
MEKLAVEEQCRATHPSSKSSGSERLVHTLRQPLKI